MAGDGQRLIYESVKAEILQAVEAIRVRLGDEAADYLLDHLHMDDERMTFRYDGEPGRLQITRRANQGRGDDGCAFQGS